MIRWNNDYNQIAHPEVMKALMETAPVSYAGYGGDEWCSKAASLIRSKIDCPDAGIYFLPGATQANFIVIDAALRPIESVICADTGHIYCHEAGSIERTAHKMLALPQKNGKITAEQVLAEAAAYYEEGCSEHLTCPKLVYLSFATEYGTLYSKAELKAISAVCKRYGMYLFVDGARLGYGLCSAENDVDIKDLAQLADVFYIGGTKCGAMFGEAVIITNPALKAGFRTYMKQNGAVMAKSWLMGLQFYTLLKEDLYFDVCKRADAYAMEIRAAFRAKNVPFLVESPTNQQFVMLTEEQFRKISKDHISEYMGKNGNYHTVRFCTSWATKREDVDVLLAAIAEL